MPLLGNTLLVFTPASCDKDCRSALVNSSIGPALSGGVGCDAERGVGPLDRHLGHFQLLGHALPLSGGVKLTDRFEERSVPIGWLLS